MACLENMSRPARAASLLMGSQRSACICRLQPAEFWSDDCVILCSCLFLLVHYMTPCSRGRLCCCAVHCTAGCLLFPACTYHHTMQLVCLVCLRMSTATIVCRDAVLHYGLAPIDRVWPFLARLVHSMCMHMSDYEVYTMWCVHIQVAVVCTTRTVQNRPMWRVHTG